MKIKSYVRVIAACGVAGALSIAAPTASAQFQEGDREIQFSGGLIHQHGSDTGTMTGDVSYGVFVSPQVELGVQQTLSYSFNDNASDYWVASTTGFANYHFRVESNPKFVPFVGAFLGGIYNEDDITGTIGPNLGFKYFVSDKTYVVTRYRYEWAIDGLTVNDATRDRSDGSHIVTVGFGYRF